jgi:hypothetical protein
MLHRRLTAALGLGLGLAHACADGGFACNDDEQCSLAGQPGQCVAGGHCAYPNEQCPSGLAYPQGAPDGLAGECVPGDAIGSGTGDEASSSGATGEDGATTMRDTEPGDASDGAGSSSGGGPVCEDAHEPNDDEASASPIPFGREQACHATWDGALDDPLDADWFVLDAGDGACWLGDELTFVTIPPLQLCVVPQCMDGIPPQIDACDGDVLPLATGDACCGLEQLRIIAGCGDLPPTMQLGIAASEDAPACLPYQAAAYL